MTDFIECYKRCMCIYGRDAESYHIVESVDEHRQYWKPSKVKVILLAESHVYTNVEEWEDNRYPNNFKHLPEKFVRFVYCLGYGEKQIAPENIVSNRGTPDYWKIFYSCLNRVNNNSDFHHLGAKSTFQNRIKNKLKLLEDLKSSGIWLLDTSILGLFRPGQTNQLDLNKRTNILKTSWSIYTSKLIKASNPEHVIVIGKHVWSIVKEDIKGTYEHTVVPQPNAFLSKQQRLDLHSKYYSVCRDVTKKKIFTFPKQKKLNQYNFAKQSLYDFKSKFEFRNLWIRIVRELRREERGWHSIGELAIANNDPVAQCVVGLIALKKDKEFSKRDAVQWFKTSAIKGNRYAKYLLGLAYRDGIGVEKNQERFLEYIKSATEMNLNMAENTLGVWYAESSNDSNSLEIAKEHFQNSASTGFAPAQYNLGVLYMNCMGIEGGEVLALEYFEEAAKKNFAISQYTLGKMLAHTDATWRNRPKGYAWLHIAERNGFKDASSTLNSLNQDMKTHELHKCQKEIKSLKLILEASNHLFYNF